MSWIMFSLFDKSLLPYFQTLVFFPVLNFGEFHLKAGWNFSLWLVINPSLIFLLKFRSSIFLWRKTWILCRCQNRLWSLVVGLPVCLINTSHTHTHGLVLVCVCGRMDPWWMYLCVFCLNEHSCTLSEWILFIFCLFAVHHLLLKWVCFSLWYQTQSHTGRPFLLDVTEWEFGSKAFVKFSIL